MSDLIGKKFPVLDHGHVILLDYMGSDAEIVEAARTSYQKGTKKVSDDRALIRYLMRHRHSTPTEVAVVKLHVKLPIFVERQWIRHRTATTNEVSARYSELPEEYYVPDEDVICQQSKFNKQGRGEQLEKEITQEFRRTAQSAAQDEFRIYHRRLEQGVARELARINLPLSTYTNKVWSVNLHNLFHLLGLRMDGHAQWEIRQYANIIGNEIVAKLFPHSWEAFQDFRLNAVAFSRLELNVLSKVLKDFFRLEHRGIAMSAEQVNHELERFYFPEEWKTEKKVSERDEFLSKLRQLGVNV